MSNTVIGAAMLAAGAVGVLDDLNRTSTVIAALGMVSLLGTLYIARLLDVSG